MTRQRIPWIAAAAVFLIHALGNAHYGYFRDELYFIICGNHPQFGYVDQPPIVPLLSAMTQVFGHSLFALRLVPAFFAAAGAFVTCLLVAEYGGGPFAQALGALTYCLTGVLMSFGMKVSTDTVGLFTWPLMALLIVRLTKGAHPRLWLGVGVAAGLTIESKYSVLFYLTALVLGLALTPERRVLFNRWSAAGAGIAIAIALPNFLWQWHYGFPMLELLQAGQNGKNVIVGPLVYLAQEVIITGFALALVWIIGLGWLLWNKPLRFVAYTYVLLIAEMMIFHGKHYYPADVYPLLIAAGAVAIEAWTTSRPFARAATTVAVAGVGLAFVPYALPVLPESTFVQYDAFVGSTLHISRNATATEPGREDSALVSDWADMHGWPELAAKVTSVYDSLPPAQRSRAVVFAGNYGEASAIEFFSPDLPVISEHNQFWLWGTRGYSGDVMIQVGGSCFHSDGLFASRTLAARTDERWAIDAEYHVPIWICRGIKKPLAQVWPTIKTYE